MHLTSELLLQWYAKNQRDLPWRNQHNPYHSWPTEIILQQTRVDQGLSYFHKFTATFPTVTDLANAEEETILKLWQGLGYYSRARNLHKSAKIIRDNYNGEFPNSAAELLNLPGVGPYTSAAIASIAFDEHIPVVDGNVLRVISRLTDSFLPINEKEGLAHVHETMSALIPEEAPGDFNQAVMELGALVCTPQNPKCLTCPVVASCEGNKKNHTAELPVKIKKTKVKEVFFYYFIPYSEQHIMAHHRAEKGIWQNLYDFPLHESTKELEVSTIEDSAGQLFDQSFTIHSMTDNHIHLLSHRRINARFIFLAFRQKPTLLENCSWKTADEFEQLPLPKLVEKIVPSITELIG